MDMITLLRSHGIQVYRFGDGFRDKHISSDRSWYQMACPICGSNRLWLGYNIDKDFFNCYNHGHATKYELFRAWFPDRNPKDLLELLDVCIREDMPVVEHTGTYLPPVPSHNLLEFKRHLAYVQSRGFDPEELSKLWGVEAIPISGEFRYRDRLLFPVFNRSGIPVSWQTRTILQEEPLRYLAAPKDREAEPLKTLLYGEHLVNPYKTLIICEGVFDAIAVGPNAVAALGKKLTTEQRMRILRYPNRIFCFDSEPDTQLQVRELASSFQAFPGVTTNVCLDAPDPATASRGEITKLREYAELV